MEESWTELIEELMNAPSWERSIERSASVIGRMALQSRCFVDDRSSVE